MRRRTVLAGASLALTSAVAGCLAGGSEPADDGNDGDPETGAGSPDDFARDVAVRDIDDVPEAVPLAFEVGVADPSITAAGRARLEVAVRNTGTAERDVRTPYYKGSSEDGAGLLLYSLEAPDSPDPASGPSCIEGTGRTQQPVEWTMEGPLGHTLDPGATGTGELVLVDGPGTAGCFPPGEYRFETDHTVDGTEFSWGFTVVVTDDSGGNSGESAGRRYGECPREVIPYDQFPADIRAEIDAALDGRHEADRVFLRDAMDLAESYVSVGGEYYEAAVTREDGREVLTLRHVAPKRLPRTRPVRVTHRLEGQRTITLELVADDGTTLIERTREQRPGAEVEFGHTARVGTHEVRVTVADGGTVEAELTGTLSVTESRFSALVVVDGEGVTVTGAVAELGICQYDE